MIIAVDGESASGKGTLSKLLAKKINYAYLDTGLLYRAVAFQAQSEGVLDDIESLVKIASGLTLTNLQNPLLKGDNIAIIASKIAKYTEVRRALLQFQRDFGNNRGYKGESFDGAILDGRDIGTEIFPNADIKFYVVANLDIRAKRRFLELKPKNPQIILENIKISLKMRDKNDKNREKGALRQAYDARILDTSTLSIAEGVEFMYKIFAEKINKKGK